MQRRVLQILIAVLALLPVLAGLAGAILGPAFVQVRPPVPIDLDSHFRFLSAVLFAIGIGWWSCIPTIERKAGRLRLLAALTFAGGLARLFSLISVGAPSAGHVAGLVMELGIVPALVCWHAVIVAAKRPL